MRILYFFFGLFFLSCSSTTDLVSLNNTCNCKSIGVATKGTILLECEGFGKSFNDAVSNARTNCLNQILYLGIPNSSSIRPVIPNKNLEIEEKVKLLNLSQFIKNGSDFIMRSFIIKTKIKNQIKF